MLLVGGHEKFHHTPPPPAAWKRVAKITTMVLIVPSPELGTLYASPNLALTATPPGGYYALPFSR